MSTSSRGAPSPPPIRVAVIGYGLAGSAFHAPLVASTTGLRLTAVVTRDPERRAQVARDHPDAQVVESTDDLWQRASELDLVVVATPNRTHVPLARAALDAGLNVVVDKPFAPTAAEGRQLVEQARKRNLLLTVYQNRRWDGDFLTLGRLIRDGALGEVFRFESRFERWRPTPRLVWRERSDPAEAGGILYDLGSHLIDQALVLFGRVDHVYAELDHRRAGAEVDDDTFVSLTHASGVRSHLSMSSTAAQPSVRMRALGNLGAYVKFGLDVQEDALRRGERPDRRGGAWGEEPEERWGTVGAGDDVRPVPTEPGAYQRFYAGVAASLRQGTPPPVDPNDAVAGLAIIEAARRSATVGRVVSMRNAQRTQKER
jgi:predicted dehydrogenase